MGRQVSFVQLQQDRDVREAGRAGRQVSFGLPLQYRCVRAAGRVGKETSCMQSQHIRRCRAVGSGGNATALEPHMYKDAVKSPVAFQAATACAAVRITGGPECMCVWKYE